MRNFLKNALSIVLAALSFIVGWGVFLYFIAPVDSLRGVVTYTPPGKSYMRQAGLGLTDNLLLSDMPTSLILATIQSEDPSFPDHYGISPHDIWRVINNTLTYHVPLAGGSTLTQQLIKNVFTSNKRSFYRKYQEMIYALKMEQHFSKEEIFVLYANMAQTGDNMFGYKQAALEYFHKAPRDLSAGESAFLVSNLPAPKAFSAWYYRGKIDKTASQHIYNILWYSLDSKRILLPYHDVPLEQKEHFFSYIREQGHMVCVNDDNNEQLERNTRTAYHLFVDNIKH